MPKATHVFATEPDNYLAPLCEMNIADEPTLKETINQDFRLCLAPQPLAA